LVGILLTYRLTAERRNQLAQLLVSEGSVKVGELAELFHVSTETIRKDLIYLENKGFAIKSHGGAIPSSELLERPLHTRSLEHVDEKNKIAQAAIQFISEKCILVLDSGSTSFAIAKLLTIKKGLTVITNSVTITQLLSMSENTVYSLGGEVRGSSMALVGPWARDILSTIKADVAFLGTDGFHSRSGPCSSSVAEAEIKKAMVQSSKRSIVVCDHSKFEKDSMYQYCLWNEIECLITDPGISDAEYKRFENTVSIIIAK
jgi:DeoR/GlpR family transcriptional regulator of sugar metabolism